MNFVVLSAQSWNGQRIPATFTAMADGRAVEVDAGGLLPFFELPDGTTSLTVTAMPSIDAYWPGKAVFSVTADDELASTDDHAGTCTQEGVPGARLTVLTLKVWRLRDVSQKVAELLAPAKRPPLRANRPANDLHMFERTDYPPSSWTIFDRDGIRFVDADHPIDGNRIAVKDPRLVSFDGESVVLELAGVKAPRLLAVSWPSSLVRAEGAEPTPFLVYLRPGVGQELPHGFYAGGTLEPYPFNHDYAYYALYQYLWYAADPLTANPNPKGIPHQIDEAGKNVVTVLPCNGAGNEFGSFMSAANVREVLLEIQAFMFARLAGVAPPSALGRLALGAFSSGNGFLAQMLGSPANRTDPLFADLLKEVYFFDPPRYLVDAVVAAAMAWAGLEDSGRRIAIYNQFPHEAHARLLGMPGLASLPASPFIAMKADGNRTVGVLDVAAWKRTVEAIMGVPSPDFDWRDVHQIMPSTMLVHAMATSGF